MEWYESNGAVFPNGKSRDDQPLTLLRDFETLRQRVGFQMERLKRMQQKP